MRNPTQQKTEQQRKIMDAFDRAALPAQTYPGRLGRVIREPDGTLRFGCILTPAIDDKASR